MGLFQVTFHLSTIYLPIYLLSVYLSTYLSTICLSVYLLLLPFTKNTRKTYSLIRTPIKNKHGNTHFFPETGPVKKPVTAATWAGPGFQSSLPRKRSASLIQKQGPQQGGEGDILVGRSRETSTERTDFLMWVNFVLLQESDTVPSKKGTHTNTPTSRWSTNTPFPFVRRLVAYWPLLNSFGGKNLT